VLLRGDLLELRLRSLEAGSSESGRCPGVARLGLVPVEELASLLHTEACVVFHSMNGLAAAARNDGARGPVGAVNVGAIAEVCWEAAVLFDPKDPAPSRTAPAKRSRWRTSCATSASPRALHVGEMPGTAMPLTGRSLQTGLVRSWMCVSVSPC
jgi:hypothetical protein